MRLVLAAPTMLMAVSVLARFGQIAVDVVARDRVASFATHDARLVSTLFIDRVGSAQCGIPHAQHWRRQGALCRLAAAGAFRGPVMGAYAAPFAEWAASSALVVVKRHIGSTCLKEAQRPPARAAPVPRLQRSLSGREPSRPSRSRLASSARPHSGGCRTRTYRSESPSKRRRWGCRLRHRCGLRLERSRE